jgi:hypothetical protein
MSKPICTCGDTLPDIDPRCAVHFPGRALPEPIDLPPIKLEPRFDATKRQELPRGIDVDVCTLVKTDLENRAQMGERKYGERLKPHNGRDALLDLYQEILDAAMYARQMLYERDKQ